MVVDGMKSQLKTKIKLKVKLIHDTFFIRVTQIFSTFIQRQHTQNFIIPKDEILSSLSNLDDNLPDHNLGIACK